MKKIMLLTVAAVLGSFSSALASPPSTGSPDAASAVGYCCEIKCVEGESVAAGQKRVMTAELTRLVARYVSNASLRSHLLRTVESDPARALDFVARAKATFSATDRVSFKRVSEHFLKC